MCFRTANELKREAQMHTLSHRNIVKLLAVVFERGNYGIVLEFVRFGGLGEFVTKHGDKASALQITLRMASVSISGVARIWYERGTT